MSNAIAIDDSLAVPKTVDLDDHRLQPASLPRAESSGQRTRRGTFTSSRNERLDLSQADDALMQDSSVVRDFEQAIVDDNASATDNDQSGRRGVARKGTLRRHRASASRASSTSRDESPSPPTSVHAFAERSRRRGRANTADSIDSDLELPVPRPHSESTAARRKPTISCEREQVESDGDESGHASVEDDVCYPQDDQRSTDSQIDFDELHEFVEEAELTVPTPGRHAATANASVRSFTKNTIAPTTPVILPSPALRPAESAFDELEKSDALVESSSSPDESQTGAYNPAKLSYWTFFSSEIEDAVKSTTIGGLLSDGESFKDIFTVNPDGGCWWLDVVNPKPDAVQALAKAFAMHPLTREDIIDQESREKVELFKNYYFVSFRTFEQDKQSEDYLEPVNIYAVVFRHGLLTFSYTANPHPTNVLKRIGNLRDYMQVSADWICYAIIDNIVDTFMPTINDIEQGVDSIEDQVYTARYEDAGPILRKIGELRKKVMSLLRLLGSKSDVIKGFAKRCNEQYSVAPRGDVGLYLSDIQDHIVTMRDNLSHSEQILSRVHSNFLSQINVDNITSGNKNNRLLGKVTLIATILVPMNLITGLFGMNVPVPGRSTTGLEWFFGIVGLILCFSITTLTVFKKLKLI